MPYIDRDENTKIIAAFGRPQREGQERIEQDDPEYIEFITPGYRDLRRKAYKPIGEQLDMIYWDKVDGTTLWQDHINEVKTQYPKE